MICRRRYCRMSADFEISGDELIKKRNQGAILLDVRSKQEYDEGHLNGAINIPEYEINSRIEKEIPKKNQLIVIYCQYGGRSRNVYMKMKQMGYNNIYNLKGGLENLR